MAFHRLVTPSYFGGLPGGYDLINTGSAPADGAKVGGPNAGTYFHAFGEDALASYFNRPIKALAQNCDTLDDYLHRDVVVMHKTADVLAGSPVASIVLPAGTYLGGSGYTNNAVSRARLFSVRDNSDRPIVDTSIAEVVVTSVTLSGGDAIGGGFSANTVTINLTPSIPSGTTYRVYYGVRQNLATIDTDAIPSDRDFALIYGHTTMPVGAHLAQQIWYAGGGNWADGTTNPATTVELQLDKIITDLEERVSVGGAKRVGYVPPDGGWFTGTSIGDALDQIDSAFRGITAVVNFQVPGTLTLGSNPIVVNRDIYVPQNATPIPTLDVSNNPTWIISYSPSTGAAMTQVSISGSSLNKFLQPLDLPDGSSFTQVIVTAMGSHSLPSSGDRAQLSVSKQRRDDLTITLLGQTTDASGSYDFPHTVTVSFAADTVDNATYVYYLEYTGETGGSAATGLQVLGALAHVVQTQL